MQKLLFIVISVLSLALLFSALTRSGISGAPPYGETKEQVPANLYDYFPFANWKRPDGPPRVGLQVGHWKNNMLPDELQKLRGNTGSSGGGKDEWEVNYEIAKLTQKFLEAEGIQVDIIPSTVPPSYWADVFLAIHADGSLDPDKSGYKIAGPWRDVTGNSDILVEILEEHYEEATGLLRDPMITKNMRGYYAFSWWRFDHAVHPMTTSAIVETGFLTNSADQNLLIGAPEVSAKALSDGIVEYLQFQGLI